MGWVRVQILPTDSPERRRQLEELEHDADRQDPLTRHDHEQDEREAEEDWTKK